MLKFFVSLVLLSCLCNAQNVPYPQHPDEVLRQVSEPSAAAVARRALRGLSIPEVIKGVYPTLPTPPKSPPSPQSEPLIEQLPVPEALRQNPKPQVQALVPQVAAEIRLVQAPALSPAVPPVPSQTQAPPDTRAPPLGSQAIAPPALNIRIVSSPVQNPAPRQNVVDLNVLPRTYQLPPQRVPERRIIFNRPAANINVVPVTPAPVRQLRPSSGPSQNYNEAVKPRSDSSDDYYDSYEFGYEIRTPEGTHSHEERKIPTGQVYGSYSMALADGRRRLVTYSADEDGFHPIVETNELGTLTSEPANAKIISSAQAPIGEVSAVPVAPTESFRRFRGIRKTKAKKSSTRS